MFEKTSGGKRERYTYMTGKTPQSLVLEHNNNTYVRI